VLVCYLFQIEPGFWSGIALVVSSIAIATLSYQFIEVPFRVPERYSRKTAVTFGIGSSIAIICISVIGISSDGFSGRVGQQARNFDAERRPVIPYQACDKLLSLCVLGDPQVPSTIVFWGDSHMLAWAPAVDLELRKMHLSAHLAVHSSCPPVWGIMRNGCMGSYRNVDSFIKKHSQVKLVVIAANWGFYLEPSKIRPIEPTLRPVNEHDLLALALAQTVQSLMDRGIAVSILGPVPTYSHDVPFELARRREHLGVAYPLDNPSVSEFATTLKAVIESHGGRYVDVAAAMCNRGRCETERDGRSIYRDDHHLSVSGALAYASLVKEAITPPDTPDALGLNSRDLRTPTSR
jgi:hypothetical protein